MTNGKGRRSHLLIVSLVIAILLGKPSGGLAKTLHFPEKVTGAKSIFLENETGNPAVLETAKKEFSDWGRFSFAKSENDGDLIVIFTHKFGVDMIGNVSFTVMDVYVNGITDQPAFESKNAMKLIWDPQRRTRVCIKEFRNRLEKKD